MVWCFMAKTTPEEKGDCIYPASEAAEFVFEKTFTLPKTNIAPENRPWPQKGN